VLDLLAEAGQGVHQADGVVNKEVMATTPLEAPAKE
jgi:hypothetical protein